MTASELATANAPARVTEGELREIEGWAAQWARASAGQGPFVRAVQAVVAEVRAWRRGQGG
jgi:hypothetical protein